MNCAVVDLPEPGNPSIRIIRATDPARFAVLDAALALAEQAGGPEDEERDQQQEAVEVFIGRRDEDGPERFDHAEQHAAHDATEDGAEPADDDDLEALEG